MPDDFDDMDQMVQQDTKKAQRAIRNYRQTGSLYSSPWQIVEGILWSLTGLAVILMLAVMPWVGDGGLITGRTWLLGSLGAILVFGTPAFTIRWYIESEKAGLLNRGTGINPGPGKGRR